MRNCWFAMLLINIRMQPASEEKRDAPEIRELKSKIMKMTAFLLYGVEEFALMNYLLTAFDEKDEIEMAEISNLFADGDRLLAGLKGSRMIISKHARSFSINPAYFKMVPSVHEEFKKRLENQKKEIEANSKKVTCKRCLIKREEY